jgi:hypothetical protein
VLHFDEAGGIKDSFTVVCGFGSTAAKWERFEIDWKLFLASYKIDYFHMMEFPSPPVNSRNGRALPPFVSGSCARRQRSYGIRWMLELHISSRIRIS